MQATFQFLTEKNSASKCDQVWVNSFGGSLTKLVRQWITLGGRRIYNNRGCHHLTPVPVSVVKIGVYCYTTDLGISLTSQINSGLHFLNYQKLSYSTGKPFTPQNWIDLIDEQISNWTTGCPPYPILIINADKMWEYEDIVKRVLEFSKEVALPIKRERRTKATHPALVEFSQRIEEINDRLKKLPNCAILHVDGNLENLLE
jgi:hypothetical protein